MKVLGIDTSTKNLSAAILDTDLVLAEFNGKHALRHSQDLIPTIKNLLKLSRSNLDNLDGFAISIGPGSFTGLRIGVATLKGLGVVTGKPIAAVPTMDVIARNIEGKSADICVVIDAKKNKVYSCIYAGVDAKMERKTGYLLTTVEELCGKVNPSTIFTGDGISVYKNAILNNVNSAQFADEKFWYPKARITAELGIEKIKNGECEDADKLVPLYLYSRECSIRGIDK